MKKVMIIFPQIVMEAKEIEVTDSQFDTLAGATKQQLQTYIWNNMTGRERENSGGKETVNSLVWSGACKIQ